MFSPSRSFRAAAKRYWQDLLLWPLAFCIALAAAGYLLVVLPIYLLLHPKEKKDDIRV